MERPTKEKTTKSGHKVVHKEWLTKGERIEIQKTASKNMEGIFHQETQEVVMKNFGTASAEEATLKAVLVSVDKKEGDEMVDFVLNQIPEKEADEIFEIVNGVTDPESLKKK